MPPRSSEMTDTVTEAVDTATFCVIRRQGHYVLIAVTPKNSEPAYYWVSKGGAEVLSAEIDGALAMRSASLPSADVVELVVEELVTEGRSGRHMYNDEQNDALDAEARTFYRKVINRYREALSKGEAMQSKE